jgi:hypothetical protein
VGSPHREPGSAAEPSDAYYLDLGDLFEKAMVELGRPRLTEEQAVRRYVAYLAWLVVSGRIGVLDGCPTLRADPVVRRTGAERSRTAAFVADEWGAGWGRPHAELEADSLRSASELLAQLDADDPLH